MYQPPTPQYNSESKFDKNKKALHSRYLKITHLIKDFFLRSGLKKNLPRNKIEYKTNNAGRESEKNQRLYFRQKATPMGGQMNDSIDTDGRTNT